MQHAGEKWIARLRGAADVNERAVLELMGKHIRHPLEGLVIERPERVVDGNPEGPLEHQAGEGQGGLLVLTQLAVPPGSRIELGLEPFQPQSVERLRKGTRLETL